MKRDVTMPCVVIGGAAPASVAYEVQRMGREWLNVERAAINEEVTPNTLALLRYVATMQAQLGPDRTLGVPVLEVVCSRSSALEMTRCRTVERFDVAEPLQRLALLARLATLYIGHRAAKIHASTDIPKTAGALTSRDAVYNSRVGLSYLISPPVCLVIVQTAFDHHLSVGDLCARVDVDTKTLGRWCSQSGDETPSQILRRGRAAMVVAHLMDTNDSIAGAARLFGYSDAANLSRQLRSASNNGLPRSIQHDD